VQLNIANKVSADSTNKPETKEPCKIKAIPQAVLNLHLHRNILISCHIFLTIATRPAHQKQVW